MEPGPLPPFIVAAPARRRQAGFTLVELLVCLTIVALMTAFLSVRLPGRGGASLAHAADDVAGALRATRERAIAGGTALPFSIDAGTGRYRDGAESRLLPPAARASLAPGTILFFPDGSSTGGIVALSSDRGRIDIRVDWLTGRVSVAAGR